jgi:hypothetical protein
MKVILSVPDEGYSRHALSAIHLISTFSLQVVLLLMNQQGHRVSCCQCIIHMTMSGSRRINMLCIKFKNNAKRTLQQRYSVLLYMMCGILLAYGKHLHGRIISLRI